MKLKEIAEKIDKSPENEDRWVDLEEIANELGIFKYIPDPENCRLKAYWIGNWYCTDSWVGYRMYFFDDEPVAVSTQDGRKSNESFEWFGPEAVKKVRNYILSLLDEEDPHVTYGDLEQDIGDHYSIAFNANVLDWSKGRYNGQPFKMLKRIKETPDYGIDTTVVIELPDGSAKVVNVRDIEFMFHVNQ